MLNSANIKYPNQIYNNEIKILNQGSTDENI
jgi:hypothetical protein